MPNRTLKLLVSTTETQGKRTSDFCFVPQNEIVIFGVECSTDGNNPDGGCGCQRSMVGILCGKATTTVKVAKVDITRVKLKALLRGHYPSLHIERATLKREVANLIATASEYSIGAILEKRCTVLAIRSQP